MSDSDKRELPKIIQKDSINKNRKIKKKKTISSNEDGNIRDSIEMPSLKKINTKKTIVSVPRTTRRKLFSEKSNIKDNISNIIGKSTDNAENIKTPRRSAKSKQNDENTNDNNRETRTPTDKIHLPKKKGIKTSSALKVICILYNIIIIIMIFKYIIYTIYII